MSETITHTRLVAVIVEWIKAEHEKTPGFCLFCDSPTVLVTEKPSFIEGFFPDVYGATTPPAVTLLGEAKTLPDLESVRSYRQLAAFFRFLQIQPQPTLILATPWRATATAKRIVSKARQESNADRVSVLFLSDQNSPC